MNLRPPGPQPGALPDCATPRGARPERATGIEPALGAWKAPVQPQHFARKPSCLRVPQVSGVPGGAPRSAPSPSSSARRRRRPRAGPVVGAAVERDDRAAERAAERRGEQRDQPAELLHRPQALQRDAAGGAAPGRPRGTCAATRCRSGRSPRRRRRCRARPSSAASSRVERLDRGARRAGVRHRRHAVVRRDGDVDDRPAVAVAEAARRRAARVIVIGARRRSGAARRAQPLAVIVLGGHEVLAAGVVDEHVEAPVALERRARRSRPRRPGSRMSPATAVAALAEVGARLLEDLRAAAGDDDARAAGQRARAAACARGSSRRR